MPKYRCEECGSAHIRILSRRLSDERLVWWVHCMDCTEDGGDFTLIENALASAKVLELYPDA